MKDFIEKTGEYNYTSFKAGEKTFKIIGTETPEDCKDRLDVIDTFKSSDNVISTRTRREIKQAFKDKKITPVESSEIKFITYSKAQWDKLVGRKA